MIVPSHNSRCREKRTENRMLRLFAMNWWGSTRLKVWNRKRFDSLPRFSKSALPRLFPTHLHHCIHPFLLFTFISIQAHPHFPRRKRLPAPASGHKSCWDHVWPTLLPACLCEKNIRHQAKQPSPHRPGHRFSVTQSWLITWLGGSSAQTS